MNGDRLFEAIGEIDCDLVNNADTAKKVRIKPFKIVIAVAAALVLAIVGTLGVTLGSILGVREKYNYNLNYDGDLHFDGTVGELLEFSKSKTVKDDIVNTVTYKDLENSFGLIGGSAISFVLPRMNSAPTPNYWGIMLCETNDFLKENQFGELYTVFKLDSGAYVYVIMSVDNSYYSPNLPMAPLNRPRIMFSQAFWVYDEVLSADVFSEVAIGKTTVSEIRQITDHGKAQSFNESSFEFIIRDKNKPAISFGIVTASNAKFLTTTGVMTISFEYDETLGEHVVSAMDFQEGCPINPEDLI